MVSIVLASHGTFAEGIKTSGQMIFGPQENVATVTLTPEMGPGDLKAKLLEAVQGLEDQEQVLFLVDLQGERPGTRSVCCLTRRDTKAGSPWAA